MSSSRFLVTLLRSERNRLGSFNRSSAASCSSSLPRLDLSSQPSTSSFSSLSSPPGVRGPKALVFELVQRSEAPQTMAQLWEAAQESIKSKRHLKSLLTSLKNSGKVKTTPDASGRSYGYSVRQDPPKQKATSE